MVNGYFVRERIFSKTILLVAIRELPWACFLKRPLGVKVTDELDKRY